MSTPIRPATQNYFNRLLHMVRSLWHELRARVELRLLIGAFLVVLGLWAFIALADEVREGDTYTVDEAILLSMRNPANLDDPFGPLWLEEMARDYTALGGIGIVALVSGVTCLYMALSRRWTMLWLILSVVLGSLFLNLLLKAGFDRPRPDLVPRGMEVYHASFPSGHAMTAASVYLTLGALLARIQKYRFQAALIMGTAILVTVLVGLSRVYLAVHWPSDVVAGWVAGAIWAASCSLVAWKLRQHHQRRVALLQPEEHAPAVVQPADEHSKPMP
jgi:undecaprenyl-diphosphatase